jgi:predicted AlkP superfamily pyrophosphatase or phosphodiesterase
VRALLLMLAALATVVLGAAIVFPQLTEFILQRSVQDLSGHDGADRGPRRRPRILFVAIDGLERPLLYGMMREGALPGLDALLGGRKNDTLSHAHLSDELVATLPTMTLASWASIITGEPPAVHGVPGNEFFDRERARFAAPAPASFRDLEPALAVYTEGYANELLETRTVYEKMRDDEPNIVIWSSMLQYYKGADKLITTRRGVLAEALAAYVVHKVDLSEQREIYGSLDREVVETVCEELSETPKEKLPDVLTVYLSGPDLYAHEADGHAFEARRMYVREIVDPALAKLHEAVSKTGFLDDAFVVVTSDHGHTDVIHDEAHALSGEGENAPPAVLTSAGFHVRPFELETEVHFDAVFAYQGALAYLYLADRSACRSRQACDWKRSPRFAEDVLVAADALASGPLAHALDMILVRPSSDAPFEVYAGGGRTVPVDEHLEAHPRPSYVAFARRLRDLTEGPHGARAGDVILLANNGNEERIEDRYYFSAPAYSWHGSPSRQDWEFPLVLAHRERSERDLATVVSEVMGDAGATPPSQEKVGELLLRLRKVP